MVTPTAWTAVVTSDREYYDRMLVTRAQAGPPVPFPAYSSERRFPLVGKQMRIGRRSPARGLEPEIDLAGPPADPGQHERLLIGELEKLGVTVERNTELLRFGDDGEHIIAKLAGPDGGWALFDPGSANGTFLNGREIATGDLTPLHDGDCINLGAWTAMTLHHG